MSHLREFHEWLGFGIPRLRVALGPIIIIIIGKENEVYASLKI